MTENRRFEKVNNRKACKLYMKHKDVPETKKILLHGFKHVKRDKVDNSILIGCKSDEIFENDRLFNFWSDKFINKEIGMKIFRITGSSFMTLVKNIFSQNSEHMFVAKYHKLIRNVIYVLKILVFMNFNNVVINVIVKKG